MPDCAAKERLDLEYSKSEKFDEGSVLLNCCIHDWRMYGFSLCDSQNRVR